MSLTYGGVPLLVPTAEMAAWIEANIATADVTEFARPFWPGGVHHDWPVPTHKDANRPILLNRLYWPRGASRWAMGHFVATDAQVSAIRRKATAGGTHTPLTLIMAEGSSTIRKIAPSLYMLPARPLQEMVGTDAKKAEGLWLLTLVDERYFWWERNGNVAINDGVTTWAQLYAAIGTALGVTITADTVASEYLLPSKEFAAHPQCLPLMLDAVAASVGHKIIRKLDGSVHAQGPTTAKASFTQQRPTLSPRQAGGEFALNVGKPDLAALVPSSVTVKFQRKDDDVFAGDSYSVQTTLVSLQLAEYLNVTGRAGTQVIHCAGVADYQSAVLQNGAELTTLAEAITRDWYLWKLARLDWKAAGILPWVPEGMHDHIEWCFAPGGMFTRIQRPEWNDITTATQKISAQSSEGDVYNYYEDLYVTNLYVTNINGGDTCVAVEGEASGTAALTGTTWADIPGTSVSVTVTNEATAQLVATFHFDGNGTADVTYDGSGAGSLDVYEGRFLIDGVSAGPIAKCSLTHPEEEKTISLHPVLVTLPVGTYTVKMQARRASGTGQALAGLESGFTLISACSGGGVGPNITVNNLTVNNYLTYSPYEVTLTTNTTNFTINSSITLVNLTQNVEITNLLFSRTFVNGDQITIINTSSAYYLTLKITGNIETYSLTEISVGPNMVLKLVYFAADVSIPRTAGVKLYKDPCWHQPYRPNQITSNQASYALAWSVTYFDFDFDADRTIYGFANYYPGRLFFFFNRSAFTVTIPNDSSSAGTAAQRVYTQTGQSAYIGPNQGAWFMYDGNAQRWRMLTGQIRTQMSITEDAAGLKLVNDEDSPADGTIYAKIGGSKGWKEAADVLAAAGGLAWVTYTKTYADFATAGTTNTLTLRTMAAKSHIMAIVVRHTAAFTGGGLAAYALDLGSSGTPTLYATALNVFASPPASGGSTYESTPGDVNDHDSSWDLVVKATSGGGNLNAATAGSVRISFLISVLP